MMADRAPVNTQLGTDLAQGPALGVQVRSTLNIHGDTVMAQSPKDVVRGPSYRLRRARRIRWRLGCDVLVDVEEVARIVRPLDLD
jgi:hypothetical protein